MKLIYKMLTGTSLPGVTVGLVILSSINMQGDTDIPRIFLKNNDSYDSVIYPRSAPGLVEAQYLPILSAVATLKYPN